MSDAPAARPRLLSATLSHAGWPPGTPHEPVRHVLPYSGVWRLRQPGGGTAIYKEAAAPLDQEHGALAYARSMGLPVPRLLAAVQRDGRLGMIMTDLGQPDRDATADDAATIAAALHRIPASDALPTIGPAELSAMPARIAARARDHALPDIARVTAAHLAAAADRLSAPAGTPPVGLCHSEFHPTSVIINAGQWHTYDLARAFHGPGLIDLASWHGTTTAPDPQATAALITAYVNAGGHPAAQDERAGLPPEQWALGWHRIWACDWYTQQLDLGWAIGSDSHALYSRVITRHLIEAAYLLGA
jgi:aminoglycoside phosphotransferase (APT) family kinase protein